MRRATHHLASHAADTGIRVGLQAVVPDPVSDRVAPSRMDLFPNVGCSARRNFGQDEKN